MNLHLSHSLPLASFTPLSIHPNPLKSNPNLFLPKTDKLKIRWNINAMRKAFKKSKKRVNQKKLTEQFEKDMQAYLKFRDRGMTEKQKISRAEQPFLDVILKYRKMGVKIPNLTTKHNIFRKNPLYMDKINIDGFYIDKVKENKKAVGNDDKNLNFLIKLDDTVSFCKHKMNNNNANEDEFYRERRYKLMQSGYYGIIQEDVDDEDTLNGELNRTVQERRSIKFQKSPEKKHRSIVSKSQKNDCEEDEEEEEEDRVTTEMIEKVKKDKEELKTYDKTVTKMIEDDMEENNYINVFHGSKNNIKGLRNIANNIIFAKNLSKKTNKGNVPIKLVKYKSNMFNPVKDHKANDEPVIIQRNNIINNQEKTLDIPSTKKSALLFSLSPNKTQTRKRSFRRFKTMNAEKIKKTKNSFVLRQSQTSYGSGRFTMIPGKIKKLRDLNNDNNSKNDISNDKINKNDTTIDLSISNFPNITSNQNNITSISSTSNTISKRNSTTKKISRGFRNSMKIFDSLQLDSLKSLKDSLNLNKTKNTSATESENKARKSVHLKEITIEELEERKKRSNIYFEFDPEREKKLISLFSSSLSLHGRQPGPQFLKNFRSYFRKYRFLSEKTVEDRISGEAGMPDLLELISMLKRIQKKGNILGTWKKNFMRMGVMEERKVNFRKMHYLDFCMNNFEKEISKVLNEVKIFTPYECKDIDLH